MDVWIGATDWPRQEGAIRGAAITRITCYSKLAIGLELVTQRVQQVVGADPDTCQSRPRIRCAPNYSRQKGVMLDASNRNLGIGPDARVREKWSTGVHVWGRKTRGGTRGRHAASRNNRRHHHHFQRLRRLTPNRELFPTAWSCNPSPQAPHFSHTPEKFRFTGRRLHRAFVYVR